MSDDRQVFRASTGSDDRILRLEGELDAATVSDLANALATLNGETDVVLDLSGLTFIDSSGLHAIVAYARSREPHRVVTLTDVSPHVLRLFEITRLTELPSLRIHG